MSPATAKKESQATTNVPTLADYDAALTKLGSDAAKGRDAYPLALVKIVEAAHLGVVDLTKDKFGAGLDDLTKRAEAYAKGRNAAVVFDAKADNFRKLRSNFGKCIKFGLCTKFGPGEPIGVLDRLLATRRKLLTQPGNANRLEDTANSMLRFMTAQLKRDTIISDGELSAYIFKLATPNKNLDKAWRELRKKCAQLATGKYARCPEADDSAELSQITALINQRRNTLLSAGVAATHEAAHTP